MGLDMYLDVRKSINLKKSERTIDLDNLKRDIDNYECDEFGCSNSVSIGETICYWRKANQIHSWFVENCQDGEDDCRETYIAEEKLRELYDICKGIIAKVEGKTLAITDNAREWIEKENDNLKKNGKKPRVVKDAIVFSSKNLKRYLNGDLWNYSFEDKDGSIGEYIKEVLPPREGFFFGSNTIDGGYLYDIIKTILMFERLFKNMKKWDKGKIWYDLYYKSSW